MSNVAINVSAEFTGKAAFNKAGKSVSGLEKSVGGLAKKLVGLFAIQKVLSYSKASVKAFSEDEAAATRLSNAIDNLGLSYSKTRAADFIADLEKTAGVADDVLRPAFQALLTTTGSLTKSQELLNNAIQISRGTGRDLSIVAQDLANGYVGITKGLKKYNLGLTQSELKTKSFSEVLGLLLTRSAGAAEAYLETTAYKMNVLSVAAGNASEKIGAGLVDAFAKAAGGTSAADAAKAFDTIADAINGISSAIGGTIGFFTKFIKKVDEFTYNFDPIIGDSKAAIDARKKFTPRMSSPAGSWARTKQQRDAETLAAKRAKELAALAAQQVKAQKALSAEQKKQALAKKQGSLFDMEQIQIIAALKGNISEQERLRLELQLALINGNETQAAKLSAQLADSIDATGKLKEFLRTLPEANNPFKAWDEWLKTFKTKLDEVKGALPSTFVPGNYPVQVTEPGQPGFIGPVIPETNVPSGGPIAGFTPDVSRYGLGGSRGDSAAGVVINNYVSGSVVTENRLIDAVLAGTQTASLSGSPSQIGRINGMFN